MSELDLLNLARSATENQVSWFGQVITINFAMIVGIYYFLNQAKLAMKIFAFVAYVIGMMIYLGQMLIESSLKLTALNAIHALPHPSQIAQNYVGVYDSWVGLTTIAVFNGAFWVLAIGVFYLLFFWRKTDASR